MSPEKRYGMIPSAIEILAGIALLSFTGGNPFAVVIGTMLAIDGLRRRS